MFSVRITILSLSLLLLLSLIQSNCVSNSNVTIWQGEGGCIHLYDIEKYSLLRIQTDKDKDSIKIVIVSSFFFLIAQVLD